ncbi:hypothetical protein ASZ78_000765 [Callipepla squamata]|uniref:Uncharacterized protein n=1 Tax=Callipepla squamata TaxID=9009 RepID=A0A226MYV8_CALSU|nr:hypothetical protein ASZ78_000765 [Callipepla squamata]
MGASGSAPTTPAPGPLRNRHLAHVSDPRSPSAGILRTPIEAKKHMLGENPGEKEVAVDVSRSLKAGNCAWRGLDKENQQCPFVEN